MFHLNTTIIRNRAITWITREMAALRTGVIISSSPCSTEFVTVDRQKNTTDSAPSWSRLRIILGKIQKIQKRLGQNHEAYRAWNRDQHVESGYHIDLVMYLLAVAGLHGRYQAWNQRGSQGA